MYTRLLAFIRCAECSGELELIRLAMSPDDGDETSAGVLRCGRGHRFPVVAGIPRLLPDAMRDHWPELRPHVAGVAPELFDELEATYATGNGFAAPEKRTLASFNEEWEYHELGGRTWGMELAERVRTFFLEPLRLGPDELRGKVVLDAGCGNGSQSVAYTELGVEVIALDLSTGVEKGHAYRALHRGARPDKVHFVQGDVQRPPLAPASVDVIHAQGVLYHTRDTRASFAALRPLLRPRGLFYVWLYKYEPVVTPVVNTLRKVTTRIPADSFGRVARLMATPFIGFQRAATALGIREYPRLSRWEAAVSLMDIFAPPYAHYHSFDEVVEWYRAEGFEEVWGCNDGRRGFDVCGRLPALAEAAAPEVVTADARSRPS